MARLDYEAARSRDQLKSRRPARPIGPAVRPTRSRKRYVTLASAENAARYVNEWGQQRNRYEWFVQETEDGQAFELWRRPRASPGRERRASPAR